MSHIGAIQPGDLGVTQETVASGLLNVGPGATSAALPSPTSSAAVAGVWGYVGPLMGLPSQTSSPPFNCAVYAQGGVVGANGYAGTLSDPDPNGDGVIGFGGGNGVRGFSSTGTGVSGTSTSGAGVTGASTSGSGVIGTSATGTGVTGNNTGKNGYGVVGSSTDGSGVRGDTVDGTAGVVGVSTGKGLAGRFDGTVQVNGNLQINGDITTVNTITAQTDVILAGGQDCAEQFDIREATAAEPGTLVVIDDDGALRESHRPYDKRVAGVISGAGEYRPAIVLDRRDSLRTRAAVALVGKVYCKADADFAPIAVGDLLTTSGRPGFAMKAADPTQAFGAVIGKALRPLGAGQGLIPILVALQ